MIDRFKDGNKNNNLPVNDIELNDLVNFHGGVWFQGDLDTDDDMCRYISKNSGFKVVSVDYRLAPEHFYPSQLEDGVTCFKSLIKDPRIFFLNCLFNKFFKIMCPFSNW